MTSSASCPGRFGAFRTAKVPGVAACSSILHVPRPINGAMVSSNGTSRWRSVRAAFGVYKTIRRRRAAAGSMAVRKLQESLLAQTLPCRRWSWQHQLVSAKQRARSSALSASGVDLLFSGYLGSRDDRDYMPNFRCSCARLDVLVQLLSGTALESRESQCTSRVVTRGFRKTRLAREMADPPTLRYKVACCMYAMGQGGPIKVLANTASIGESSLRRYLALFSESADGPRP